MKLVYSQASKMPDYGGHDILNIKFSMDECLCLPTPAQHIMN